MKKIVLAALLSLSVAACASTPAPAPEEHEAHDHTAGASPADEQAARVCQGFDDPSLVTEQLAPSFLAQIPAEQVVSILGQVQSQIGSCTGFERVEGGDLAAQYAFSFDKGFTAPVRIAVEPQAPHKMSGLWIGPPAEKPAAAAE